jgi:hypothetical protein
MSLEQKIAELMEQARQLESVTDEQETTEEIVSEEQDEEIVEEEIVSEDESEEIEEEQEEIEELSKSTLGSYAKKAAADTAIRSHTLGMDHGQGKSDPANAKKMAKRGAGTMKAITRLTKESEEVEMIDLGTLFEGTEFTEEFRTKATEMFEAAVAARVKQEVEIVAEGLVQHSLEESEELKEGLVEKVDGYLDYVVEQWMKNNELALDRGIKVEIFESFMSGMKDLLESHYIDVPEQKFDVLEDVSAQVDTLEQKLDEVTAENVQLIGQLKQFAKEKQIQEASEGLSDLEKERLAQLAEELTYDDEETFAKKLDVVKENFVKSPKQKSIVESVVTDSPVEMIEETTVDPKMKRYLNAIKG